MKTTVGLFHLACINFAVTTAGWMLDRMLASQRRRPKPRERQFESRLRALEQTIAVLQSKLKESLPAVEVNPAPSKLESPLPFDRAAIVQQFEAGRTPEQIAPLLSLPLATVRFVLDIRQLSAPKPQSPQSLDSKQKLENAVVFAIQNTKVAREWRDAS